MPKGRPMRRKNGTGSVVKLSGRRRCPYEVRINTRLDERNYPVYDVLGRFSDRDEAAAALLDYTANPYDIKIDKYTFEDIYNLWYDWKYVKGAKKYSKSSISCTTAAYKKCAVLHDRIFKELRTPDMQIILDNYYLSHAYMEHIQNLFKQMYKFALQFDYIEKDYAQFTRITKEDDDESGVPFTPEEITRLWQQSEKPWVDSILILIYSGFRISELLKMPVCDIDTNNMTFKGGVKTAAGKNRIVPIHSEIQSFVCKRLSEGHSTLLGVSQATYRKIFNDTLLSVCITEKHTPHYCRHTFATLLDNAEANPICIKRLMGHSSGNDTTEKVYTHKDIEQLRKAIEMI